MPKKNNKRICQNVNSEQICREDGSVVADIKDIYLKKDLLITIPFKL